MFRKWILALATGIAMLALPAEGQTIPDRTIGTWVVKVPDEANPANTFYAIHTYHADGSITEVSSLLPLSTESPAQGQWKRDGDRYQFVFQLLSFEKGVFNGYIRVRGAWQLTQQDRIQAEYTVDLIGIDGRATLAVARGKWDAVRLKLDPALPVAAP